MYHALLIALGVTITPASDTVPLYTDLGNHHHRISTRVRAAQQYFDQGLRLVFAFNHGEAIRAFAEAARLDPKCAICHWGIAYAYGPHVNAGMDSASGVAAWRAVQKARQLRAYASPTERAYIEAVAARYAAVPPADRAALDSAYARAMRRLVRQYPNDLDAATLYAESLMDLSPWNYWTSAGEARPDTPEILGQLERVLAREPNHPGACHYYIHAVEAVTPEKAVPCAERLAALMPGAGHMVHMPAHIYIRVGRYNDAIEANHHAVHADESYIASEHPAGLYPVAYYPHNYHFLAFAASLAGRSQLALESARKLIAAEPLEVARQAPQAEPFLTYDLLMAVTFGQWDDILARPLPPADLGFSSGLARYARGVALAATGHSAEARKELDSLSALGDALSPKYAAAGWFTAKPVLEIAAHSLRGEIALREGQADSAVAHFEAAAALEDHLPYIEPPDWYYPVRHSLGMALLAAGRPAEAEAAYRADLKRFPGNGWSLFGLAQALEAQGKSAEAADAKQQFDRAWAEADVKLAASRF